MNNVNELHDAWIAAGQAVTDLNQTINNALLDESTEEATFKDDVAKRDAAIARRDALKDQYEMARAEQVAAMDDKEKKPLDKPETDMKDKFVQDFKDMIAGKPEIMNLITSDTDESGNAIGLTIPSDIQTTINTLMRQYDSLQQYVNVESVTTSNGSRVYEKFSDITPLVNLDDENAAIGDNDDPKLHLVKYLIKRYAGISTLTNSLLKDTADNILTWLSGWISKKVVVTRNKAIIDAIAKLPNKPTIANFDDVKDVILTGVDAAIQATSFIITNKSGFAAISKVKDAQGRYLVQPSVTNPEIKMIEGKTVIVIEDRWLPDVSGAHPFGYGDLKQAVTLFDRENMSLLTTNIGGGAFEKDQTKVRVIDRFDVETTDDEAFVWGSFKAIADQAPAAAAAAPSK